MSSTNDAIADERRLTRLRDRSIIKRDGYAQRIRFICELAERCLKYPNDVPQLVVAVELFDSLWSSFSVEDDAVLDHLIDLDISSEYSNKLIVEINELVIRAKSIVNQLRETVIPPRPSFLPDTEVSAQGKFVSVLDKTEHQSETFVSNAPVNSGARLPEIPLPSFNGEIVRWPAFRDRFGAMVDQRVDLLDIDKMYYLLGCLKGSAADALRGIPVPGSTYRLAWSTLDARYNKPRLVACSLVETLLHAPVAPNESVSDLNKFMVAFSESVLVLESLKIPNLGDFIIFSMASRCLPTSVRTMFKSQLVHDFPSVTELFDFVKSRINILERAQGPGAILPINSSNDRTGNGSKHSRIILTKSHSSFVSATPAMSPCRCKYCDGSHALETCRKFRGCSTSNRLACARTHRLCFRCLSDKHWANRCKSNISCNLCSRKHHVLLHPDENKQSVESESPVVAPIPCTSSSLLGDRESPSVLLGTALVHVRDSSGSLRTTRALIDSASQVSAITSSCVNRLGLKCTPWTAPLSGLSGVPVLNVKGRVRCQVRPRFADEPFLSFQAWVLPSITGDLPRRSLHPDIKDQFSHLALADPTFDLAAPVDLLLGADLFPSIMDGRQSSVHDSLPGAFSSIFGWILIGSVSRSDVPRSHSSLVSLTISIESLVDRFWHVEEPAEAPLQFTHDGQCEAIYQSRSVRLGSGQFAVPLPFRTLIHDSTFAGSCGVALQRFDGLERKLKADDKLRSLYLDFMTEYLSLGHMSVATSPGRYFIPHHAVYKPDVSKPKFRVVFDASAHSASGLSLNSALLAGPKLQNDIVDVLTRFRLYRHAFSTDICKMYRQIFVLPEYRAYQHIFWRPSPHAELVGYELNTVTYGVNCAPFLALRVLQSIAESDCTSYPHVRDALRHQTYVDDICYGADTEETARSIQLDLITVLGRSGLELRKWASNTPSVLQSVAVLNNDSLSVSRNDAPNHTLLQYLSILLTTIFNRTKEVNVLLFDGKNNGLGYEIEKTMTLLQ